MTSTALDSIHTVEPLDCGYTHVPEHRCCMTLYRLTDDVTPYLSQFQPPFATAQPFARTSASSCHGGDTQTSFLSFRRPDREGVQQLGQYPSELGTTKNAGPSGLRPLSTDSACSASGERPNSIDVCRCSPAELGRPHQREGLSIPCKFASFAPA